VLTLINHVPVRGLYKTHISVSDLQRSVKFYREVIGLLLALETPDRNAAFFRVGDAGSSMLGLWSLGTAPPGLTLQRGLRGAGTLWVRRPLGGAKATGSAGYHPALDGARVGGITNGERGYGNS
jgi:catechol 2,3-dioxygenase-like lactoylglutathione lyase family enzyme